MPSMLDAVAVEAGPNGLTAAVEPARRGPSVAVCEAYGLIGGGPRSEELTLPGLRHDPCSAARPLGIDSPASRALPLQRYGLQWLRAEPSLFPRGIPHPAVLIRASAAPPGPGVRGMSGHNAAKAA